jgi:hypothetical protein
MMLSTIANTTRAKRQQSRQGSSAQPTTAGSASRRAEQQRSAGSASDPRRIFGRMDDRRSRQHRRIASIHSRRAERGPPVPARCRAQRTAGRCLHRREPRTSEAHGTAGASMEGVSTGRMGLRYTHGWPSGTRTALQFSTGALWTYSDSSISLTRKSATLAREMNPIPNSCGSARTL